MKLFKQSMKMGIDLLWLRPKEVGGTEAYIKNLLKGLQAIDKENEYYLFISQSNKDSFDFVNSVNFHKVFCKINNNNKLLRIIYTNLVLPWKIKKLHLDVVFFPTYMRPIKKLHVYSISNINDLQYLHYPKNFSLVRRLVFNIFYPISLKKSDKIIAISNFVKQDIIRFFERRIENLDSKIVVIYIPIEFKDIQDNKLDKSVLDKWGLKEKEFIYTVSSMFPYKNLITLLRAFVLLNNKFNKIKLVISGISGPSLRHLQKFITDFDLKEEVVITGFISDYERDILYANCLCFVFPSIFEGFGMPATEAMLCKVPVIVSDIPVMREVTRNKAIYVPRYMDPEEWFIKLLEIVLGKVEYSLSEFDRNLFLQKYNIYNIAKLYMNEFKNFRNL